MTNMKARCELVNISAGTLALLTGETNYSALDIIVNRWIAKIDAMPEGTFETCNNWEDVLNIVRGDSPATTPEDVSELAPDHITAAGVEMPAEYRTSSTGRSITATYTMDGDKFRVVFSGVCGELFTACQRATKGETVTVDSEGLMIVLGTATEVKPRQPREVNPDKERHGEVPEKWFIGQALEGKAGASCSTATQERRGSYSPASPA